MPYVITKTNGQTLAVIEDAEVDIESTSLALIGKNYAGYGLVLDQNFVKLLENFSNSSQPDNTLQGQLWFDNNPASRKLNVCHDGSNFKSLANLNVKSTTPSGSTVGDLWWDTSVGQLKAFDGSSYKIVGPEVGTVFRAGWFFESERSDGDSSNINYTVIKAKFDNNPILTIARLEETIPNGLTPLPDSDLDPDGNFQIVKKGITLAGCDINGVSSANTTTGFLFWGTASDALAANAKTDFTSTTTNHYVTFAPSVSGNQKLYTTSTFFFNPATNVLNATATAARYADLAERYAADAVYSAGTVVVVGGDKEITVTNIAANTAVAGVISKSPAYMMNSEAGDNSTHPYVALKGRVLCKVYGPVTKGDLLVTSRHPGYACVAMQGDHPRAVFAVALESFSGEFGIIEVKI
jgi:hypothetical protein